MKVLITETQYKRLVEDVESPMDSLVKYKPVCFKYWDRFGPGITNKMVNVLGIKKYVGRFEYNKVLYQWLREYIGVENTINVYINKWLDQRFCYKSWFTKVFRNRFI